MWTDVARTTHPSVSGDKIRLIDNKVTPLVGTLLTRYLTNTVSDATSPSYEPNIINGLGVGQWDGSDDELAFSERMPLDYAGKHVTFIVMKNDDAVNGSHVFNGALYWVVTAYAYNGGLGVGVPYSLAHFSGSFVDNATDAAPLKNTADGWNVLCLQRNGTDVSMWSGHLVKNASTVPAYQFVAEYIGRYYGANTDWWMHGKIARITHYNGNYSDADVVDGILALMIEYNIP
jgi:hypothetical protein